MTERSCRYSDAGGQHKPAHKDDESELVRARADGVASVVPVRLSMLRHLGLRHREPYLRN